MTTPNPDQKHARDNILNRLLGILEQDERVRAVWLSGSFGRGSADDWSDIDIHIAVNDVDVDNWLSERADLHDAIGQPVLVQRDVPAHAGEGVYQGIIMAGPVWLDLNMHPASKASPQIDTRILFDRLPLPAFQAVPISPADLQPQLQDNLMFFWAMTPIALKYVGRGETHRAATQLNLLLGAFITTWRLVNQPERREAGGAFWLHPIHDASLRARLPSLDEPITSLTVLNAISRLMSEMTALHPAIEGLGVSIPDEAVTDFTLFRDSIASSLAGYPRR